MGKILGGFAVGLLVIPVMVVLGALVSLVLAWPVMLILGAASVTSGGLVPAIGYWTTFWIVWAVRIAVAATSNSTTTS